jgi:hypothetical protein
MHRSQERRLVEVSKPAYGPSVMTTKHSHLSDQVEIALDVTTNGRLQLPPYPEESPSMIHNIHIFLYSYTTGRNFTITNGTASANNASLGDIMFQEPGSTVKHVRWVWPDCLVGDGQPKDADSDRGVYNVGFLYLSW